MLHAVHPLAPDPEYWPLGQAVHDPALAVDAYLPLAHVVHPRLVVADGEVDTYLPAGHVLHAVHPLAPDPEYWPLGQAVQDPALAVDAYVPLGHVVHPRFLVDNGEVDTYLPVGQVLHELQDPALDVVEYLPLAHVVHPRLVVADGEVVT